MDRLGVTCRGHRPRQLARVSGPRVVAGPPHLGWQVQCHLQLCWWVLLRKDLLRRRLSHLASPLPFQDLVVLVVGVVLLLCQDFLHLILVLPLVEWQVRVDLWPLLWLLRYRERLWPHRQLRLLLARAQAEGFRTARVL